MGIITSLMNGLRIYIWYHFALELSQPGLKVQLWTSGSNWLNQSLVYESKKLQNLNLNSGVIEQNFEILNFPSRKLKFSGNK